jgi:hypothetical protein
VFVWRPAIFVCGDKFYQQQGNGSWHLTVTCGSLHLYEHVVIECAKGEPSLWLRYVDDTFVGTPGAEDVRFSVASYQYEDVL